MDNKQASGDWTLQIFVPLSTAIPAPADPAVETHSLRDFFPRFGRIEDVDGKQAEGQWAKTINSLMRMTSSVSANAKEWAIDEIEVGLTLSAKGELLFIAEAGAEASIKFLLKRK